MKRERAWFSFGVRARGRVCGSQAPLHPETEAACSGQFATIQGIAWAEIDLRGGHGQEHPGRFLGSFHRGRVLFRVSGGPGLGRVDGDHPDTQFLDPLGGEFGEPLYPPLAQASTKGLMTWPSE